MLDRNFLVRLFGFRGAFLHGDPMVADRWRFLRRHLPVTTNGERLLDAGCGSGAFTIGAATRGYRSTGLSWDERNQAVATERARICGVPATDFPICDLRRLGERDEFKGAFDVVLNCENMEHIIADRQLMRDIAACLKPGGRLLFTAPDYDYKPVSHHDNGPFEEIEDGRHVRRGYTAAMLRELCADAGLMIEKIDGCSFFFARLGTRVHRWFGRYGWLAVTPLRILPPLFDWLPHALGAGGYSICLVAYKPRFAEAGAPILAVPAVAADGALVAGPAA